ncbi:MULTISPECIES: DUF1405 domain-containing protein [unclassified Bacillus (in: firmicutes)]|uniref:DUF1405 domain-containing protein n=1 Tax=unclassified Bacillus (in: firmicutes) TaxID=185979 RepID=UPI000BF01A85|nr:MULTISPECIES: DUF1405 domain-containing protein [unclassified Bacillus (in: firmicutes)]PEJ53843.1 hypothetical protein CN692_20930 [Bacillus sp. AFS002410]PEL11735.1 hypothetical protein CN601_09755 [Bacillus sp. AFS017336]
MVALFIINVLGTAYGYYWYIPQLAYTPSWLKIFVPDSPTASLFFCVVLLLFILNKQNGLIEALAYVSLLKYGIWAVIMNGMVLYVKGGLDTIAYLLIFSHGAMAVQALLYSQTFRVKKWQLVVASIWILQDLIFDYVFGTMPEYFMLSDFRIWIALITFWLTILVIFLAYYQLIFKKRARM